MAESSALHTHRTICDTAEFFFFFTVPVCQAHKYYKNATYAIVFKHEGECFHVVGYQEFRYPYVV